MPKSKKNQVTNTNETVWGHKKQENTYKSALWRPIEVCCSIAMEGVFPNNSPHVNKRIKVTPIPQKGQDQLELPRENVRSV